MPFFSCEMTFETFTRTPKNKFFPRQFVSLTFFSTTVSPLGTQTSLHRYRQGAAKFKAVYSSAFLKSRVASLRLLNLQAECGLIADDTVQTAKFETFYLVSKSHVANLRLLNLQGKCGAVG